MTEPASEPRAVARIPVQTASPRASIVPRESIAGRALTFVVAIMAFLASLTVGVVAIVSETASQWRSDIAREVTIQIRLFEDVEMDKAIRDAGRIALEFDGVAKVTAVDEAAVSRLLEPWLGSGLAIDELPVPRLLTVTLDNGAAPNFAAMRQRLEAEVPGASLDDHRAWIARLNNMAWAMVLVATAIFAMVMAATVLNVVFATRGAMAANRDVVEVLHFVGADVAFIASQFQRHFLVLGLAGAAAGGAGAAALFIALGFWSSARSATPDGDQVSALFGTFSVGPAGYAGIVVLVALIAGVTALTSRLTVNQHVRMLETARSGAV